MEQLDLEQARPSGRLRAFKPVWSGHHEAKRGTTCGSRLIKLRKYSPLICLIELMAIGLFAYLLLFRSSPSDNRDCSASSSKQQQQQQQPRRFTWRNGTNDYLLLDLVPGCDQRKHDRQMSEICTSYASIDCRVEIKPSSWPPPPPPTAKLGSDEKLATIIVTSKRGERLALQKSVLKLVSCPEASCEFQPKLVVMRDVRRQKIIGWGGALTDSSINNLLGLTTNGTNQILEDYFGFEGLMFNMIRITIGGSDFSSRLYTNDDLWHENYWGYDPLDLNLNNFTLREEDILYKIPVLKLIQEKFGRDPRLAGPNGRQVKLFASMWSPPLWMKTNRNFNKGQLRGKIDDEPLLDPKAPPKSELFYNALAELKTRFIQAYLNQGVNFWGLTVMNEPIFAVQPFLDFNTMIFPADDYANYVAKYLGPKLKGNARLRHIKLIAHDDNRRFLANFTWPMLDRKRVRQFIDGVSVHGYADEAYHLMSETFSRYRDDNGVDRGQPADAHFFVLPTELCSGHLPFMAKALLGNWHRGVHYALDIIRSLQNSAAGWVDWNMVLDLEGGPGWWGGRLDAPVIVDKARDLYHRSPMFYVLGQFSRYIPPGSQRLESAVLNAEFDHQFETVAFLLPRSNLSQPEQVAIVILNNNPYEIDLHVSVGSVAAARKFYSVSCPADSIQTVICNSD